MKWVLIVEISKELKTQFKKILCWMMMLFYSLIREFAKSRAKRAYVPTWSTCQRACVPAWFTCQRACVLVRFTCQRSRSVPTSHFYLPVCQWTCQRAIRRANISTWRANVPKGVPNFLAFLLPNSTGNFYALYLILSLCIYVLWCIVHKNCIRLYFYDSRKTAPGKIAFQP